MGRVNSVFSPHLPSPHLPLLCINSSHQVSVCKHSYQYVNRVAEIKNTVLTLKTDTKQTRFNHKNIKSLRQ